jgi:endonuclease YncB( thermonuclease family)
MRLALALVLALCQTIARAEILSGKVVGVTDGDTVVVLDSNYTQHKIRLSGIDAPERGQAFGTNSKQHLADLIAGESVTVEYDKYDKYDRIVGKILLDGEDVNLKQVEAGMAWHYKQYQKEQKLLGSLALQQSGN